MPTGPQRKSLIPRQRSLKPVYLVVALALLGLIGYWRFHSIPFNWAAFAANFRDLNWSWAALGLVFILLTYVGRAIRWQVMIRPLRTGLSTVTLLSYTLIGFTAVVLTGRPGEFVRPYLIAQRAKVPVSTQLAAWVIERILDLFMVLFIFGIALSQISRGAAHPDAKLHAVLSLGGWMIGILAVVGLILLFGFRHFRGTAQQRISDALTVLPERFHLKVDEFLRSFSTGMAALRSTSTLTSLVLYSIIEWAIIGLAFYSTFQAFPATADLSYIDVIIALGFVSFGAAVQIPGIGGGMQVAAIFVLTELYQLTFEQASGVALALWLVNYVSIVPLGLLLAFKEGLNWNKIKNIEEEAEEGRSSAANV